MCEPSGLQPRACFRQLTARFTDENRISLLVVAIYELSPPLSTPLNGMERGILSAIMCIKRCATACWKFWVPSFLGSAWEVENLIAQSVRGLRLYMRFWPNNRWTYSAFAIGFSSREKQWKVYSSYTAGYWMHCSVLMLSIIVLFDVSRSFQVYLSLTYWMCLTL